MGEHGDYKHGATLGLPFEPMPGTVVHRPSADPQLPGSIYWHAARGQWVRVNSRGGAVVAGALINDWADVLRPGPVTVVAWVGPRPTIGDVRDGEPVLTRAELDRL